MKRCSAPLIIREMQITILMRYHLTPVIMANIKKSTVLAKMWRKVIPFTLLVSMKIDEGTIENSIEVPQKNKNKTTIDTIISLPVIYLKQMKTLIGKDKCTSVFIAALFTIMKI